MSDVFEDKGTALTRFGTDVHAHRRVFEKLRAWLFRKCFVRGQRAGAEISTLPLWDARASLNTPKLLGTRVAKYILTLAFLVGLLSLLWFSLYLAEMRMYPANACANVSAARLLAAGHTFTGANLYQILLSWYLPNGTSSVDLFALARVLMLVIFWANWILIALATGEKLFSFRWLVALAGAASLAPFWNWGFEIRGSNLILTGLLLVWGTVRFRPAKPSACFFVGVIAVVLQCVSANAFVYTVPLSLGILVFQPMRNDVTRWKLALAWMAGATVAFLVLQMAFATAGFKDSLADTLLSANTLYDNRHSGFWNSAVRMSAQAPLLWALVVSALAAVALKICHPGKSGWNRDGILPEAFFFGVSFIALFMLGNSIASGMVILIPVAYLLAYRHASALWKQVPEHPLIYPMMATLLVFLCVVPFVAATRRGLGWSNTRQERLMNLAEELTDPVRDCLYDPVGLVPTRTNVGLQANLHWPSLQNRTSDSGDQVQTLLAVNAPAVIIRSYRLDQLSKIDQDFIRKRYVAVADDFLVLGKVLPKGGGSFQIHHPGRYRISPLKGSGLTGTYFEPKNLAELVSEKPEPPPPPLTGTLDGKPLPEKPVEMSVGFHQVMCAKDREPAVVWAGPRLKQLPKIGSGNHDLLFYKWY